MKLAYFINQYPKVSHSFIRREIHALESLGQHVERYALRGWDAVVADPLDEAELKHTRHLLRSGPMPLVLAALAEAVTYPLGMLRAVWMAFRFGLIADRSMAHHLFGVAEAAMLSRWTRRDGIDHVHAHFGTNTAEICMLASVMCGLSYSFTIHGPDEWDQPRQLGIRQKVQHARFVVAISSYTRAQVFRWCRLADQEKVKIVHCGPGDSLIDEPPAKPSNDLVFVCVGRLCAAKSQHLLIEAAAMVVNEGYPVRIVLVGDGEMRADVEAMVDRHRLRDHVTITGWASEAQVRAHLVTARAMVLPSLAEGLPVAIMEAMALGRPVIATYIAGIPELVRQGQDGWLVPAGDVRALATAMIDACKASADVIEEMGRAARQRVSERHRLREQAVRLMACFQQVGPPTAHKG